VLRRSFITGSAVNTWTAQASWNVDVADGTGCVPARVFTNINVFQIQVQYLGAGAIIFSMEDETTGTFTPVHMIAYANNNTVPHVSNPSLPFCAFVDNGGTTTDIDLHSGSVGMFTEGKILRGHLVNSLPITYATENGTTETAVLTIRNRATFPTTSAKTNRIIIYLEILSWATDIDSNRTGTLRLHYNPTLTGTPVTYGNFSNEESVIEFISAGGATYSATGTTVFSEALGGGELTGRENLDVLQLFLDPGDIFSIGVTGSANNAVNAVEIALTWLEDF